MTSTHMVQQSGVVPYRFVASGDDDVSRGSIEILLITTRTRGVWSLPKGHVDLGMTATEAAENEAWEEAGVQGEVEPVELGIFAYKKYGFSMEVQFFPMLVNHEAEHWLEEDERERRWCRPAKAMVLLEPQGMTQLVQALVEHLASKDERSATKP